jgi:SAM-dependent methyltransferase
VDLSRDWFADESFWEAIYPLLFSGRARTAAAADVGAIKALIGRPVTTVLDLCCGAGRHSVAFAKQGSRVTGVDRSAFLLGHARQYALDENVEIRWEQQDMRDFVVPARFDLATSLFTSFGYFDDPAENQRVLANVHASLAPGGAFVLDVLGKEVVARIYEPCRSQELADGGVLIQRGTVIDDWARIENEWHVIRDDHMRSFRFRHWLYSAVELRQLLNAVGFVRVDMFGNLEGAPYGVEATRLVARAYKAG